MKYVIQQLFESLIMALQKMVQPIKFSMRPAFRLWQHWVDPVFPLRRMASAAKAYPGYLQDWRHYQRLPGAEALLPIEGFPQLLDRLPTTPFDPHYLYQAVWATERIIQNGAMAHHIDVGSDIKFVALLASHLAVTFVDIRPLEVDIACFFSLAGSLLELPFADNSVPSLSCLHVIEHIGLGRYGDPLDPSGSRRACAELQRVLALGGSLFLSTPVGIPRVQFNAHRIHSPKQVQSMFPALTLVEFSGINDSGDFVRKADLSQFENSAYACGLFWLRKEVRS